MNKTYEIQDYNGTSKQVVEVTMVRQTKVITQPITPEQAVIIADAMTQAQKSPVICGAIPKIGDELIHTDGRKGVLTEKISHGDLRCQVRETFGHQGVPRPDLPWDIDEIVDVNSK